MRLKLGLLILGGVFLLILGWKPDALPFLRYDARYSDAVTSHWPAGMFLRESVLQQHTFPLWRQTIMAGQPFAANPLNKVSYPFQWLVVILPTTLHLQILFLLHWFVAGAGMWVWARSMGLRIEGVVIAVLAFTLSPRVLGHLGTGHLDIIYSLAWWPWLMWSVRRFARQRDPTSIVEVGLSTGLIILADIRVSLFALLMAGVYGLFELQRGDSIKALFRVLLSGLIVIALTASLFVPLVVWQPYMTRANLSPMDAGVLALQPIHLLGLILPAHRSSVETLTYLGLPSLFMAGIGLFSSPRKYRYLLIGGILSVALYTMGTNAFLWPTMANLFPALLWFRVPSRAWLVLTLLIPILAGFGLQAILQHIETPSASLFSRVIIRRLNLTLVGWIMLAVTLGIFAIFILQLPVTMGLSILVGGSILGGLLLTALNRQLPPHSFVVLLVILTYMDLAWTDYQWVAWREEDAWLDPQRQLAEKLVSLDADRIYSPTYSLEQQVAEVYHLRLFGGVDPFQLAGIVHAVQQGSGVVTDRYDPVLPSLSGAENDKDVIAANRDAVIDTEILAEWNISHIVAAYPIVNDRLQFVANVEGTNIYANLDYHTREGAQPIPDWPANWPDLPEPSTVEHYNQLTIVAWLVSMISFLAVASTCLLLKWNLRHA